MYSEQQFNLPAMQGLSEKQIAEHLKLYAGYVKNTNELLEKLHKGETEGWDAYTLNELRRRIGFEWNGMRLHELYFGALGGSHSTSSGQAGSTPSDTLKAKLGDFDGWLKRFKAAGAARGIGWMLLVHDKQSGMLENIWVNDHDVGHLAGADVIIAMDVWEHAFLFDYLPAQRKDYIEAFFANLNWNKVEERLG